MVALVLGEGVGLCFEALLLEPAREERACRGRRAVAPPARRCTALYAPSIPYTAGPSTREASLLDCKARRNNPYGLPSLAGV